MLSEAEIKRFIDDDRTSEKKIYAAIGQRYYEADHDILRNRLFYFNADGKLVEDKVRANIKISHPFFTELSDQLASYILSGEDNPIRAVDTAEGLQEHLDEYFDEAFWSEVSDLISGTYNKGFEYIYGYKGADGRLVFECADSLGVVEVREKDTDDGCKYIIYWYVDRIDKGKKKIKRIQVWTDKEIHYFVQSGDNGKIIRDEKEPINPCPHVIATDKKTGKQMGYPLGFIPFWRLDNNKKQISGLKPIKQLIDDYDLHACSLSNNLKDFDTPLHVVVGFQGDNLDELQTNLKTKKIIGVDEGGGVAVQTVDIPYQARKEKLEIDEKNIYRFGFGLNTIGLKDTTATTNIAIKAAYSLLDMKAKKLEKRLKMLLKDILKPVLDEINEKEKTDYQLSDVYFEFDHQIMVNEAEMAAIEKTKADTKQVEVTTLLNIAAQIGDEQTLRSICEIMDFEYEHLKDEVEKFKAEQEAIAAKAALEGAPIDEEVPTEGLEGLE